MKKERMPLLIPVLAAGVKVILWVALEETEGWGGGSDVVGIKVGDVEEGDDEVEDNNDEKDEEEEKEDDDDATEADDEDTETVVAKSVEKMSDNDANEVKNDDVDAVEVDDVDTGIVRAKSVDGMLGNACIMPGFGSPPASLKAAIPHVFGPTRSLDVIAKRCVLADSSFEKLSICMWQTPFSL